MHYWIFGVVALIFFIVSFNVGIRKKLYLISTIDKADIEKIDNKDYVSRFFGIYYFFLGLISLLGSYITSIYGLLGMGISIVVLMLLFFISVVISLKIYWLK